MAQMIMSYPSSTVIKGGGFSRGRQPWERQRGGSSRVVVQCCSFSSTEEVGVFGKVEENERERRRSRSSSRESIKEIDDDDNKIRYTNKGNDEECCCLVSENGWQARRLVVEDGEMRRVASIQAEAFHTPVFFFNHLFFEFFKAEVLAGLLYKLKNSPPDRYACLVAEPTTSNSTRESPRKLVGVVDVTVQRDEVLQNLQGAEEYLYVSGLAVSKSFRRRKIGSLLLKACDMLAVLWGFEYLVLRAYEEDLAAQTLYSKAGYQVVSGDPPWISTWIGRKRRVVMTKRLKI